MEVIDDRKLVIRVRRSMATGGPRGPLPLGALGG